MCVCISLQYLSRKKIEMNVGNHISHHPSTVTKPLNTSKKKKATPKVSKMNNIPTVCNTFCVCVCSSIITLFVISGLQRLR